MTILLAVDDTDNYKSRGTGRLARAIAGKLSKRYPVHGVTRHQLYVHPDIPFTSHNSCAVIHINNHFNSHEITKEIFETAKQEILQDFIIGSDPGLAVAHIEQISPSLVAFGKDAKNTVLTQDKARRIAGNLNIQLEGLGGTEDGVIGAMAGLGLASTNNDGRYLQIGQIRSLTGPQPAEKLLNVGIDEISTTDGVEIKKGIIFNHLEKSVKPCPVNNKVILFVEKENGKYFALKRD
jgi:hypothetical protein